MRIALLGASNVAARRVARDLREQTAVTDVIEVESVDSGIQTCDLMVGSTGERAGDLRGAEIAIERVIPFLSSAADSETIEALLGFDEKARTSGTQVIAGLGWTIGLSWAMVRAGVDEIADPTEVRISSIVSAAGELGAAELSRLAKEFSTATGVFESGGWRRVRGSAVNERVYFPEPLGWREVWAASGAEVGILPRSIPSLRKVTVLSGITELLSAKLLSATLKLGPPSVSPLVRLASRTASRGSSGRAWSAIRADVSGRDGTSVSFAILDQLPNLLTAPLVAAVTMFAGDRTRSPGAMLPEAAFSPSAFFAALAERGVRVARLIR